MPLQTLIVPLVVVAFIAIIWRFLPRAADGSIRLPAIIDESVGMWLVRSALGRATDPTDPDELDFPEPAEDEIAYRIGVPGAPPPTMPTRVVVSQAPSKAESALSSSALGAVPPIGPGVGHRSRGAHRAARPTGALAAQRRWAGAAALAALIIAVATVVLGSRQLGGEVLSATGTPAGAAAGGFVGAPAGGSLSRSSEPSSSPTP
jgi:hypothetical protein